MRVLMATSEVAPFAKTGGLADVCGALPTALQREGVETVVIMPAFRQAMEKLEGIWTRRDESFDIPIGGKIVSGGLYETTLSDGSTRLLLVRQDEYYDRPELYVEDGRDYQDNCERFVFFCRAVMETITLLNLQIDVLHCNDWPTALLPAYLALEYRNAHGFEPIASVITIHNMAYQGMFWHWDMLLTGLDWRYFNWRQLEYFGQLNLLKAGLVFADAINTVSPRYAMEIQEEPHGCGLEGVLRHRKDVLTGIINGVDYDVWNPATDEHLPARYDVDNWREGKAACKAALQAELGLPVDPERPLIGLVGRLADQKGWDLVAQVMQRWQGTQDAQWAILGTGDPRYHELLAAMAREHSHSVSATLGFSNPMAHRIEAGADLFLMPSRYEPCGLNQLYSLKYGTVPVVRATGGLADTIVDANEQTLRSKDANGFAFHAYDDGALEAALQRACDTYRHRPEVWQQLVETGMRQDWSWANSARRYREFYADAMQRRAAELEQLSQT